MTKYQLIQVIESQFTALYPKEPLLKALEDGWTIISACQAGQGVQYILELQHEDIKDSNTRSNTNI